MTLEAVAAAAVPVAPEAAAVPVPRCELTLEDPIVDEMLVNPPPPPPRAAPAISAEPAAKSWRDERARAAPARVPIVKTAALAASAARVGAAGIAQQRTVSKPSYPLPPAPRTAPTPTAAASRVAAHTSPRTEGSRAEPPRLAPAPERGVSERPTEATSLASWANARAATAAVSQPRAVASAAAPRTSSAPAPASVGPPMDRDFIARNQVVERYLSGRLPLKGATDFERFCHEQPQLLDEIGLPERVNAGLRLLEASGKPEPWQEAPPPPWQRPRVMLGLAGGVLVLGVALAIVAAGSAGKSRSIAALQRQAFERALDPATSTREIRLLPSRSGASNVPAITIGGGSVQLADFKIDESRSPYHTFRITIDRIDQGRVGVITNLGKDSNGHLRIALNSSALGPGNYQLTIEGLGWHGDLQPDSWVTIGIAR